MALFTWGPQIAKSTSGWEGSTPIVLSTNYVLENESFFYFG